MRIEWHFGKLIENNQKGSIIIVDGIQRRNPFGKCVIEKIKTAADELIE